MMVRRDRGLTAVELIVVIMVVGIAAAVTVPALLRTGRNDRLARCEANLKALGQAALVDRSMGPPVTERGGTYWEAVARTGKLKPDVTSCPLSPHTRYRGPGADPATLPPPTPIGADVPGAHGNGEGGNVLMKTGEVRAVRERDSLWQFAAERLAP